MPLTSSPRELWFITGSQHLYGPETLQQVELDSQRIASNLDTEAGLPLKVTFKHCVKTPDEITRICLDANGTPSCVGVICWMAYLLPSEDVDPRT